MKQITAFLFMVILSQNALAQQNCYASEIDPRTNKIFVSDEVYQSTLAGWTQREPEHPGLFSLYQAYSVYKKEVEKAGSLGNDKRAHCYMGCRISQATNYRTTEYVGWLKEDRDIKDCNKGTRFEYADFDATVAGAQFAQSQEDAEGCVSVCKRNY